MNFINFQNIKFAASRALLKAKAASPELALGAGIICGIGAIVTACMATRKIDDIIRETHDDLDIMEAGIQVATTEDEVKEFKKEIAKIWVSTGWKFVKLYAPSAFLAVASGGLILTSHGILKNRYLSTAAAYKALDESYKAYRRYVADELGYGDGEKAIAARAKCEDGIQVEEDGELKTINGKKLVVNGKNKSPYEFDFNRYTAPYVWDQDPVMTELILRREQDYANDLLQARGHVFLNEVLDRLGMERTSVGQVVGWFKGAGDNEIDFGYLDSYLRDSSLDQNLCRKNIHLNFNCDGVIYDLLEHTV